MNSTTQNLNDPTMCPQLESIPSDANTDDMFRVSTSTSITTLPLDSNENRPTQLVTMTECSFFYRPNNDFEMYHITCNEVPRSSDLVSWLINNSNHYYDQSNDTYIFYHEQTDSKRIY